MNGAMTNERCNDWAEDIGAAVNEGVMNGGCQSRDCSFGHVIQVAFARTNQDKSRTKAQEEQEEWEEWGGSKHKTKWPPVDRTETSHTSTFSFVSFVITMIIIS